MVSEFGREFQEQIERIKGIPSKTAAGETKRPSAGAGSKRIYCATPNLDLMVQHRVDVCHYAPIYQIREGERRVIVKVGPLMTSRITCEEDCIYSSCNKGWYDEDNAWGYELCCKSLDEVEYVDPPLDREEYDEGMG